jgi:hypothetical protein
MVKLVNFKLCKFYCKFLKRKDRRWPIQSPSTMATALSNPPQRLSQLPVPTLSTEQAGPEKELGKEEKFIPCTFSMNMNPFPFPLTPY